MKEIIPTLYIEEIKQILLQARQKAYNAVNTAMVEAYWKIGERIVLQEQKGEKRAEIEREKLKLNFKNLENKKL